MKLIDILSKKKYLTDKHTVHRYIQEFYEEEFLKYKDKKIRLLEIGVLEGESLKLWSDYFTNGEIVGIDIFIRVGYNKVEKNISGYNIPLNIVDSFNDEGKEARDLFISDNKDLGFDIIIDDGLHSAEAQFKTFNNFKPLVNKNGLYVIEDIRTSSLGKLSEIDNIEFLELNDGPGSKVKKQHIGVIRF